LERPELRGARERGHDVPHQHRSDARDGSADNYAGRTDDPRDDNVAAGPDPAERNSSDRLYRCAPVRGVDQWTGRLVGGCVPHGVRPLAPPAAGGGIEEIVRTKSSFGRGGSLGTAISF